MTISRALLPMLLGAVLLTARGLAADDPATAVNQLGLDLERRIAAEKSGGNMCLSPYSIQAGLVMAYAGAAGDTEREMARVLHYPKGDRVHEMFGALQGELAKDASQTGLRLKMANRLFGQKEFPFQQPFRRVLDRTYHAPLEELDFTKSAAAERRINGWVAEETSGKIERLLAPGLLDMQTRLVLVDAAYFKGAWKFEFAPQATRPNSFELANGKTCQVPTMTRKATFGYVRRGGCTTVALPYAGGRLQCVIFLPDQPGGLPALERGLTTGTLAACRSLPEKELTVWLPRFRIAGDRLPLAQNLKKLGMKKAFDVPPGSADFSAMAPRTEHGYLALSHVMHQAYVEANEKGTEAAAATAVVGTFKGEIEGPPLEVRINRPFFFVIQHVASGTCLFMGRVTDPREGQ